MSQDFVIRIAGGKDEIKEGESFNIFFSAPEWYWNNRSNPSRIDRFLLRSVRSGQDGYIEINEDFENFYSHDSTLGFASQSTNRGVVYGYTSNYLLRSDDDYEESEVLEVELYLYRPYGGGIGEVLARNSIIIKDYYNKKPPNFGNFDIKDWYPQGYFSDSIRPRAGEIWIDNNIEANKFVFSAPASFALHDGLSWEVPAIGVGGTGDDTYEVYAGRFVVIADGAKSISDTLNIKDVV